MRSLITRAETLITDALSWITQPPTTVLVLAPWSGQLGDSIRALHPKCHYQVLNPLNPPPEDTEVDWVILLATTLTHDQLMQWSTWALEHLRPGGLMLTLTLGPDTFQDVTPSFPVFCQDMHDLGDAWEQAGWSDPVVDRHLLTLKTSPTTRNKLLETLGWSRHPNASSNDLIFEWVTSLMWLPQDAATGPRQADGHARISMNALRRQLKTVSAGITLVREDDQPG